MWTSGHHEIFDGETYGEIWLENDASLDMWGSDVFRIGALGTNKLNMYGGTLWWLMAGNNSTTNLYGGSLDVLDIGENAILNLHAYDVQYHSTGGYWNGGWVEGKYLLTNNQFAFDMRNEDVFLAYVNIVPEPGTILLLAMGTILIRKKIIS